CSGFPGTFTYFPASTVVSHSTREKLTFHVSPALGAPGLAVCLVNAFHGIAISTSRPRSVSDGSLIVPCTFTAVLSPSMSQELSAFPCCRYGLGRVRSHTVFSALISSS